jgi:hypothetical protein
MYQCFVTMIQITLTLGHLVAARCVVGDLPGSYRGGVSWKPGQRRAQRALELPYENVPDHLRQPLWNWVQGAFSEYDSVAVPRMQQVAIHLRMPIGTGSASSLMRVFLKACNEEPNFILDLVEALLELYGWDGGRASDLKELLTSCNSVYTVSDDWNGLAERLPQGVAQQLESVVAEADASVSEHLVEAWNSAYGRKKNPAHAYSEAIRAAETALRPIVSPNEHATIFKMIGMINDAPQKWHFVLGDNRPTASPNAPAADGVQLVLDQMRLLAYGESKRHGGEGSGVSEDEAKAAVMLAVSISQACQSGGFARRPTK